MKDRFTRGYNEQNLADGKRDHSAEELFTNELKLPVHKVPVKELRRYHLARRHLPSKLKNSNDLATTRRIGMQRTSGSGTRGFSSLPERRELSFR